MDAVTEGLAERVRHLEALENQTVIPHDHSSDAEGGVLCNHVRATTAAGQSIPNAAAAATVIYGTQVSDTGGEYNPATGVFTAGRTGYLHIDNCLTFTSTATWATSENISVYVYVNGLVRTMLTRKDGMPAAAIYANAVGSTSVYVTAGQTVTIRVAQNSGAALALHNDANLNWVCFDWMP